MMYRCCFILNFALDICKIILILLVCWQFIYQLCYFIIVHNNYVKAKRLHKILNYIIRLNFALHQQMASPPPRIHFLWRKRSLNLVSHEQSFLQARGKLSYLWTHFYNNSILGKCFMKKMLWLLIKSLKMCNLLEPMQVQQI